MALYRTLGHSENTHADTSGDALWCRLPRPSLHFMQVNVCDTCWECFGKEQSFPETGKRMSQVAQVVATLYLLFATVGLPYGFLSVATNLE